MFGFTKKKIEIPTGETQQVTALESWYVSWYGRDSDYSTGIKLQREYFLNEEDAKTFANQVRAAFKFLKFTHRIEVTIDKTK